MLFFSSGDLKRGALTWFPLCSTQYTSDARRRTHVRPHSLSEQHLSEVGDIKKFKRTVNTWGHKQMAHAPPWYRVPPPPPHECTGTLEATCQGQNWRRNQKICFSEVFRRHSNQRIDVLNSLDELYETFLLS